MSKSLRTKFMDHMVLQRFSRNTISNYMSAMKKLAKFYNKSPDMLTSEEIQDYLIYLLKDRKFAWATCNLHLTALACFYKNVLHWDERKFKLPPRPRVKKLPNILSVEEVKKVFECAVNLKHRVLLKTVTALASEPVRL